MRTLEDAERDYDRALADGAAAVQMMDKKLQEMRRTLAAVVLSAGGRVSVTHRARLDSFDVTICISEDIANDAVVLTANRTPSDT